MLNNNEWTKSSFSNGSGGNNCVEVMAAESGIWTRHSRNPYSSQVRFTRAEWEAFVQGVKAGEFDLPPTE